VNLDDDLALDGAVDVDAQTFVVDVDPDVYVDV